MKLGDDEMRHVLVRASEIEQSAAASQADVEILMDAAEEVGIPRAAVERALRERMLLPMKPPTAGQLTFARSADDKYYVAEVVRASSDGFAVRFLRGSEHTVQLDDLRPCSFLPGERIVVNWPWWGPWTCTVLSYDMNARRVTVTDGWGEIRDFPIGEVWIGPRKAGGGGAPAGVRRKRKSQTDGPVGMSARTMSTVCRRSRPSPSAPMSRQAPLLCRNAPPPTPVAMRGGRIGSRGRGIIVSVHDTSPSMR